MHLLGGDKTTNQEDIINCYEDQDFGVPCELSNEM
jgi:hypothetical protein